MKPVRLLLSMCLGLSVIGSSVAAQSMQTLQGTLIDTKCYLADPSANVGNDHGSMKECGTMCLKGGSPGGLLTADKKIYTIVAPSTALASYVGQTVRVRGEVHGEAILAKTAEVNKNGKWQAIKLGTMM